MIGADVGASAVQAARWQRIRVAVDALMPGGCTEDTASSMGGSDDVYTAFVRLIEHCSRPGAKRDDLWLTLTALFGRFPTVAEQQQVSRRLALETVDEVAAACFKLAFRPECAGLPNLPMRLVDQVMVEVGSTAGSDLHSGIQRVVRETVSRWNQSHSIMLASWDRSNSVLRSLTEVETARVLRFRHHLPDRDARPGKVQRVGDETQIQGALDILVPWHTTLISPDVPNGAAAEVLEGLARNSGTDWCVLGHDLIPVTSADLRPTPETNTMVDWLVPLKYAARVVGVSESSGMEFAGFASMLAAQGLKGPRVTFVREPIAGAPSWLKPLERSAARQVPTVLLPGTRESHKNHRALLHAAERLWEERHEFQLQLMGRPGWGDAYNIEWLRRAKAQGRDVVLLGQVSEQVLWETIADADLVAFASLHEGFGLPVAEALAVGTPVITTAYGSQAEIAAGGGAVVVDPRNDDELTDALRELVTDHGARARLAAEAASLPRESWADFAEATWDAFTGEGGGSF